MARSTVQTLDISPVGRVEGDLDVRVDIQDGHIVDAWTQAELFRGFEVILRDKDPQAGLVVTPRACGIGTPIADATDPVEVGHVCRSYDSCLVCTVHAYDAKTGAQPAMFRTA